MGCPSTATGALSSRRAGPGSGSEQSTPIFPMARARTTLWARFQSPHLSTSVLCPRKSLVLLGQNRAYHHHRSIASPVNPPSLDQRIYYSQKNPTKNSPKNIFGYICHQPPNSKPRAYIYRHFPSTHSPPSDVDLRSISLPRRSRTAVLDAVRPRRKTSIWLVPVSHRSSDPLLSPQCSAIAAVEVTRLPGSRRVRNRCKGKVRINPKVRDRRRLEQLNRYRGRTRHQDLDHHREQGRSLNSKDLTQRQDIFRRTSLLATASHRVCNRKQPSTRQ